MVPPGDDADYLAARDAVAGLYGSLLRRLLGMGVTHYGMDQDPTKVAQYTLVQLNQSLMQTPPNGMQQHMVHDGMRLEHGSASHTRAQPHSAHLPLLLPLQVRGEARGEARRQAEGRRGRRRAEAEADPGGHLRALAAVEPRRQLARGDCGGRGGEAVGARPRRVPPARARADGPGRGDRGGVRDASRTGRLASTRAPPRSSHLPLSSLSAGTRCATTRRTHGRLCG